MPINIFPVQGSRQEETCYIKKITTRIEIGKSTSKHTSMPRMLFFMVGILILPALLLGGCTPSSEAIDSLGQPPCLSAIAAGRATIAGTAHFGGVKYLSVGEFISDIKSGYKDTPNLAEYLHLPKVGNYQICVAAWKGNFNLSLNKRNLKNIVILKSQKINKTTNKKVMIGLTIVSARTGKLIVTVVTSYFPFGFAKIFPHIFETPGIH